MFWRAKYIVKCFKKKIFFKYIFKNVQKMPKIIFWKYIYVYILKYIL